MIVSNQKLTGVVYTIPTAKPIKQTIIVTCHLTSLGNLSQKILMMAPASETELPSPRVNNMRKKRTANNCWNNHVISLLLHKPKCMLWENKKPDTGLYSYNVNLLT